MIKNGLQTSLHFPGIEQVAQTRIKRQVLPKQLVCQASASILVFDAAFCRFQACRYG